MMGLFDTFTLQSKCPRCGVEEVREFQTKSLGQTMSYWEQGEKFDHPDFQIRSGFIKNVYATCKAPKCKKATIKKQKGFWGGFGRLFYADVHIFGGTIRGAVEERKKE